MQNGIALMARLEARLGLFGKEVAEQMPEKT